MTTGPKNRNIKQTIAELILHIDGNIDKLPEAVKAWNLDQLALDALKENLLRERVISFPATR